MIMHHSCLSLKQLALFDLQHICAVPCDYFRNVQPVACYFVQKMLRVKDEELSLQERRENSYHRRRRYSEDYDSEADLYQQYKAAGLNSSMVAEPLTANCRTSTCSF